MFLRLTFTAVLAATLVSIMALAAAANDQSLTTQSINQMPLAFTKNMGQWDDRVLFRGTSGGATMWFTKEGVTYQFTRRIEQDANALSSVPGQAGMPILPGDGREQDSIEQLVLAAKFLGGNTNPEVVTEGEMEYKCNYFLGNDESKWRTDVPNYKTVTLKEVYPGIDVRYSNGGAGQAAYEFLVAPGADMSQIKVAYEGAEATSLDADGQLTVQTKWGSMTAAIGSPAQSAGPASLRLALSSDGTYGIKYDGQNASQALSAVTVLVYSTYLGGGGLDHAFAIAVDGSGNSYVTGWTYSSNFPAQNAYDSSYNGNTDAFVSKLSSAGNSMVYSTYVGGGNMEVGLGIVVNASGCAYVTGWTASSTFPTQYPYQTDQYGEDAFVVKLSSSGNSLIYSTYLGGESDDAGEGIVVDTSGNAYVTGATESADFPCLNSYQADMGGLGDAFVTKFSSAGSSLIYSTFLGASNFDRGIAIAISGSGNAYVTGETSSSTFPTLNPYQTYQGNGDVFVTKFSSSGASLIYSTCLGGGGEDDGNNIVIDSDGNAYVTGTTLSSNFPTQNAYQTDQSGRDAFVTKLNSAGNSLIYSTYLGGNADDYGNGIVIDGSGCAYVAGETYSSNFPTLNPYQTDQGNNDAFVTKVSSGGNSLIYSTYLGGDGDDRGWYIAIDNTGNAYVTGQTYSSNFPTLNPYQTNQFGDDAFVTKLRYFACVECGDADGSGRVDISDRVFLIEYIFGGGAVPGWCNYAVGKGDANGDGNVDISDAVYLSNYIFQGGPCPHCKDAPCW